MKALVLQNSTSSGLGILEDILLDEYCIYTDIRDARKENLAKLDVSKYELVIILGSGHSVYEDQLPWITEEKVFTKKLLEIQKPLLGICFGGQMIAAAMGASVTPTGKMTCGWLTNNEYKNEAWMGPWLRWHGDTFSLPAGANLLAKDGEVIQGFQVGSAVAIQFHPEVNHNIISKWHTQYAEKYYSDTQRELDKEELLSGLTAGKLRTVRLIQDVLDRCLNGKY
ncbi:type 1 glutamine amidotransferase [Amphritea sp. 2_MG-2023]|uniref:type 1 glutamine amidotransferase n=1 Tax=Amphritea TaxID=515417 RepID=UPI001C075CFF|nr:MULTISPECIES: type 1 glutamine amidotransferase [Amphritea]MBU2967321.1 type 1 glutamine amidotransferase [Amphritea atlantica]MDO6420469.1 type 1 glutamine amidotransferase [Amphritea sp. 2_MG-2023]